MTIDGKVSVRGLGFSAAACGLASHAPAMHTALLEVSVGSALHFFPLPPPFVEDICKFASKLGHSGHG